MKFCIVILHYNLFEDTIKCIESIKKCNKKKNSVEIIVVDNASTNGSGENLDCEYKLDEQVHIIKNKSNEGFAKGNNLGYRFAKKTYDPDFIILSNNDVIVEDSDFFEKVIDLFSETDFSVLGPDIYNPLTEIHQSPLFINLKIDQYYVEKRLKKIKIRIFRDKLLKHFPNLSNQLNAIYQKSKQNGRQHDVLLENACLHGAFWIFSNHFLDVFPSGLYDQTFMYGEEEILLHQCQRKKLKMIYSPMIQILHYEGKSTEEKYKDYYRANMFKNRQMEKSMHLLAELINE